MDNRVGCGRDDVASHDCFGGYGWGGPDAAWELLDGCALPP